MSNREPLVAQRYGQNQGHLSSEAAVLDPMRLLRLVARHWPWLLLPPLVLGGVGGFLASRQESRFESSAMVVLRPTAAQDRLSGDRSNALAERELQTEEQLLNGEAMAALVGAEVGSEITFEARAIEGTDLIELTAAASSSDRAALGADAIAELYIDRRRERIAADLAAGAVDIEEKIAALRGELAAVDAELARPERATIGPADVEDSIVTIEPEEPDPALGRRQRRLEAELAAAEISIEQLRTEAAVTDGNARLAAAAIPPPDRVSPKPLRSAVVWAMLGVLIGLGLVWLRDLLDRRIRSTADLSLISDDLEFAGRIARPDTSSLIGPASLLCEDVADRFRVLASNSLAAGDQPVTIQVTGVEGGEGATFVAANLAATLATGGWATVLVDADLAAGDLHDIFDVASKPGTKHLLNGEKLSTVVQATKQIHGLGIVAKGSATATDATLHNTTLSELLKGLSDRFDVVIVDSPPILHSGDAAVLANHVDKTILVAAVNNTTGPQLEQAVASVTTSGGRVTAVALTEHSPTIIRAPIPATTFSTTTADVPASGTSAKDVPADAAPRTVGTLGNGRTSHLMPQRKEAQLAPPNLGSESPRVIDRHRRSDERSET